ncbi:MAG: hypothetical protein ACO1OD_04205 [Croceibacterium sp.]
MSAEKGLKHVIFDDSCGVTGTTQRRWPSMPSLFFIRRHAQIAEGETLNWQHRRAPSFAPRELAVRLLGRGRPQTLECRFDREVLEMCREADARIEAVHKVPDLADFVFDPLDRGMETTQHFVVLK